MGFLPDPAGLWPALSHWAYLLVFLVVFLECFPVVGTLVPGGFFVVAAGFAGAQGILNPGAVALAAVAGAIAGDAAAYEVGQRYGPGFIARYRGRAFLPEGMLRRTERACLTHTWAAVLVGRFNQFTRAIAPIVSGAVRVPRNRFLLWNVLGALLWALAHAYGGYFFGEAFHAAYERFGRDAVIFLIIAIAAWYGLKKWGLLRGEEQKADLRTRAGQLGGEAAPDE